MRHTIHAALACALLAIAAPAQRRGLEDPKLKQFTFAVESFASEAVGRDVEFGVFLPKGYHDEEQAATRYPVVYWLHGMFEDHRRFWGRGGGAALDELAGDGTIPELIFVCPNGDRMSFYLNAKSEKAAYEDMVVKELVAHVDATYRTAADRRSRVIAGVSMGGYGALKIGLRHSDVFGVCIAHSAAVLPKNPDELEEAFPWLARRGGAERALAPLFGDPLDRDMWAAENVLTLAESLEPADLNGLKLYFDCGDQDRYGFAAPNQQLHAALEQREVDHTWRLVEGGTHGWPYTAEVLPDSMRFVAAAFAQQRAAAGLGGLLAPGGAGGTGGTGKDGGGGGR